MSIDIKYDGSYILIFHRKSYKKARHKRKADRLVRAFNRANDRGATATIIGAELFRVDDIR